MRFALTLSILAGFCLAAPLAAQEGTEEALAALEQQDLRLATLSQRFLAANAPLCGSTMPLTGLVLESSDQYSPVIAADRFKTGLIRISAIVPGSAADEVGLLAGDVILAIGPDKIAEIAKVDGAPLRDSVFDMLAALSADQSIRLRVRRGLSELDVELTAPAGCLALSEVITDRGLAARSDGRVIQVKYELARRLDDNGLAVVFAHELAHSILRHRFRLEQAEQIASLVGRISGSRAAKRIAEIEADRLSVHLLANAGYAPELASEFWDTPLAKKVGTSLFSAHPSPARRGELIATEVAQHLPMRRGPSWPGHLLELAELPLLRN